MIDELITWEHGVSVIVPRSESPKDIGRGDIKPIFVDPREYLDNYQVGPDGPPPIVFSTEDESIMFEVSNLDKGQNFWHRSMTHGELHFAHTGHRTVETENGTVSQGPGTFIWFPKGIAHRNIGHGDDVFALIIYIRDDLKVHPKPVAGSGFVHPNDRRKKAAAAKKANGKAKGKTNGKTKKK